MGAFRGELAASALGMRGEVAARVSAQRRDGASAAEQDPALPSLSHGECARIKRQKGIV